MKAVINKLVGNMIIAEYLGGDVNYDNTVIRVFHKDGNIESPTELTYHLHWDELVPVYSKVLDDMPSLTDEEDCSLAFEEAVRRDDIDTAFEVIVKAIEFINEQ